MVKPWSNTVNGQKAMFYRMERTEYEQMMRPLLPLTISEHIQQIVGKWQRVPIHLPAVQVPVNAGLEDASIAVASYYMALFPEQDAGDILTSCRSAIVDASNDYLENGQP